MWVGGEGSVDENGQSICAQKVNLGSMVIGSMGYKVISPT